MLPCNLLLLSGHLKSPTGTMNWSYEKKCAKESEDQTKVWMTEESLGEERR